MSLRSWMRAAIASSKAWTARATASSRSSPKVVSSGKSGDVTRTVPSSSSSAYRIGKHQSNPKSFLIFAASLRPSSLRPPCIGS